MTEVTVNRIADIKALTVEINGIEKQEVSLRQRKSDLMWDRAELIAAALAEGGTQRALAKETGISNVLISQIMTTWRAHGQESPRLAWTTAFARALGRPEVTAPEDKACAQCGAVFTPSAGSNAGRQVYCSITCADAANDAAKAAARKQASSQTPPSPEGQAWLDNQPDSPEDTEPDNVVQLPKPYYEDPAAQWVNVAKTFA